MSRILVIEDLPDTRRLIRWTLEPDSHQVFEANNGERGLKEALMVRPDLIVLDVMMPGELNGYEVCARLKADPDLARVPIVLLTGLDRERDREAAERAGADRFLAKPFRPLELVEIIDELLGQ